MNASTSSALARAAGRTSSSALSRASSSSSWVMISMSQPTSFDASRTFCPRRPMASDSWSSLTSTIARPSRGVEEHLLDLRRLQGVRDQHLQRVVPADDVDALAAQFLDDVLDAAAADADAGADAVHLHVDDW